MLAVSPPVVCLVVYKPPRSAVVLASGIAPEAEYTLMRSALARPTILGRLSTPEVLNTEVFDASVVFPLRTLSGRLSRLPPKTEEGANPRTDALVSRELRRRCLDELAKVRREALSVKALFAVAALYVIAWLWGTRCGGTAVAGEVGGNWWEN